MNSFKKCLITILFCVSTGTFLAENNDHQTTLQKSNGITSALGNLIAAKYNACILKLDKWSLETKENNEASYEKAAKTIANHKQREWEAEAHKHEHGGVFDTIYCYYCKFMALNASDKASAVTISALGAASVYGVYYLYKKSQEKPNLEDIEREIENEQ